jgi:hypothetical protein
MVGSREISLRPTLQERGIECHPLDAFTYVWRNGGEYRRRVQIRAHGQRINSPVTIPPGMTVELVGFEGRAVFDPKHGWFEGATENVSKYDEDSKDLNEFLFSKVHGAFRGEKKLLRPQAGETYEDVINMVSDLDFDVVTIRHRRFRKKAVTLTRLLSLLRSYDTVQVVACQVGATSDVYDEQAMNRAVIKQGYRQMNDDDE